MALALSSLRVSHKYRMTNYGETVDFVIMELYPENRIWVKNLSSLEYFWLDDLYKFGKGKDYDLREL